MADINRPAAEQRKAGIKLLKKHNVKIDMTPMVDLGFLLISFFVITTQLMQPTSMNLFMPKDGPSTDYYESATLTVLLDEDRMFYYSGRWEEAAKNEHIVSIKPANALELRKIIIEKKNELELFQKDKTSKHDLLMLIKAGEQSYYTDLVDVLDEATIGMVKKYALVKLTQEERNWMANH